MFLKKSLILFLDSSEKLSAMFWRHGRHMAYSKTHSEPLNTLVTVYGFRRSRKDSSQVRQVAKGSSCSKEW